MRGTLEIDSASGRVLESQLSQVEAGATLSELPEERIAQIAECITQILQDVNTYMRQKEVAALDEVTMALDSNHLVTVSVGTDRIRALVQEREVQA